jgi:tripeptide aminopeptidase
VAQPTFVKPATSDERLAELGTQFLTRVIAIESQSDDTSPTIPSTEGQRILSDNLREFFEGLGCDVTQDSSANLIATVPGNTPGLALALMVHMDTAEGTLAVDTLCETPNWDGGLVKYPQGPGLHVSAEDYAETRHFVGEDLLHGPGAAAS